MIKIIIALLLCLASVVFILPAFGATNYTLLGICYGLTVVFVVAYDGQRDEPRFGIKARYSLIAGVLFGVFWPAGMISLPWISAGVAAKVADV